MYLSDGEGTKMAPVPTSATLLSLCSQFIPSYDPGLTFILDVLKRNCWGNSLSLHCFGSGVFVVSCMLSTEGDLMFLRRNCDNLVASTHVFQAFLSQHHPSVYNEVEILNGVAPALLMINFIFIADLNMSIAWSTEHFKAEPKHVLILSEAGVLASSYSCFRRSLT